MTHSRLITEPFAAVVGVTSIVWPGVEGWMWKNNYTSREDYKTLHRLQDEIKGGEVTEIDGLTELCARFCYRAFNKGRLSPEYMRNIIESKHGSVLAHCSVNFFIEGVSRGLSHELVRHHVGCNPSQESQRFVDAKDMKFVVPPLLLWAWERESADTRDLNAAEFVDQAEQAVLNYQNEQSYLRAVLHYQNPFDDEEKLQKRINEAARCHLPNECETRLAWTMNVRAARHVFNMRGANDADLEIRRLAVEMFKLYQPFAPLSLFDCEVVSMPVVPGVLSLHGGV